MAMALGQRMSLGPSLLVMDGDGACFRACPKFYRQDGNKVAQRDSFPLIELELQQ